MEALENTITELSGFKISNSHFRIGSKIHISDFYYAKRFFQNGFFSSRIAFLIAKDIITFIEKENRLNDVKSNGLTIIGYEMYSELLISIVDKFLRKKWLLDERKINHNLYEDVENLRLCKKNNILGNVVIIVPIASTFSTSIKIENQIFKNQLEEKKDKPYILKPHLNVLYVSDGIPSNTVSEIEKGFSWKEKNIKEKIIEVEAIYSDEYEISRSQKFYLSLPTNWHNVEDCQLCNPTIKQKNEEIEKLENEFPLYETDRTAVTPAIIFDFPKGRVISSNDLKRKINLDTQAVTYGHHTRNNAHFLYSINSEYFLEKNKNSVQDWLWEIKNSVEFKSTYNEIDRVIIVSSCHFSNAAFITLVNDFLFSSSANIIHYDPLNDYVQNFKIVYGQEMNDADRIFFVDDSLKSGTAFDRIYQFIQNTLDFTNEENLTKGITGCFFLLNKSQPYTFKNLQTKLIKPKQIYAFANLHLYTSLKPYETSPLQIEEERYKELASDSFIDSLKAHFQKQINKLTLSKNSPKEIAVGVKASRHLRMLIATHRVYQYFTIASNPRLSSFYEFLNDLLVKTESPVEIKKTIDIEIDNLNSEDAKVYLKVLAQLPFTQYKPLKDYVFKWTIQLLIKHINDLKEAITNNTLSYELFDTLKFLIRRAGLLNSNILISKTFVEFLPKLYSTNGIPKIIESLKLQVKETEREPSSIFVRSVTELEEEISKLRDFHIFYAAQIKELLLRNESRCWRLEKILKHIESDTNAHIKQIVRILREENSLIIKVFYEYISSQADWKKIYSQNSHNSSNETIDYTNEKIIEFLNRTSISRHHKFQILNTYFDIIQQPKISGNKNLLNYLWLQYFLSTDKYKQISLNFKTELILKKLMQMFIDSGISNTGAFFIVNDSQKRPFIAFNKNYNGISEVDEEDLKSNKNDYIYKFFNGENNSFKKGNVYKHSKTLIELKRTIDGKWVDLFSTSSYAVINELSSDFIASEYNRLVLIRLNRRSFEKPFDKSQGIIGFYYNSSNEEIIDINIIRYLLLLRPLLSDFIEHHHENDEFRDWQIAEIKQKTSLLTGHGREMLINVALKREDKYKDIVYTLLTIQRLLIDKKEESENLSFKSGRIKKIFEGFFQKKENVIDQLFFNDLGIMASQIFSFEEIENQEELDEPILSIQENIRFSFDKHLLNMICFEILVNAKKNRWLFSNEIIKETNENEYDKNKIWIEAKLQYEKLIIEISNTGPELSDVTLKKVNRKKNIKRYDNSSGIELIDTILSEFELGEINFRQKVIKDRLARFTATITLNQNLNGK